MGSHFFRVVSILLTIIFLWNTAVWVLVDWTVLHNFSDELIYCDSEGCNCLTEGELSFCTCHHNDMNRNNHSNHSAAVEGQESHHASNLSFCEITHTHKSSSELLSIAQIKAYFSVNVKPVNKDFNERNFIPPFKQHSLIWIEDRFRPPQV